MVKDAVQSTEAQIDDHTGKLLRHEKSLEEHAKMLKEISYIVYGTEESANRL